MKNCLIIIAIVLSGCKARYGCGDDSKHNRTKFRVYSVKQTDSIWIVKARKYHEKKTFISYCEVVKGSYLNIEK